MIFIKRYKTNNITQVGVVARYKFYLLLHSATRIISSLLSIYACRGTDKTAKNSNLKYVYKIVFFLFDSFLVPDGNNISLSYFQRG